MTSLGAAIEHIDGTAPDGTRIRESTGTTSWEKARKILARKLAEHDPVNKPLFEASAASSGKSGKPIEQRSIADAVEQFLATKRGESAVDMVHYEGFFERELLVWCKEQGLFDLLELDLEQITKFRNSLQNATRAPTPLLSCCTTAPRPFSTATSRSCSA